MESEFGESTNAIRVELNRFEKAGLLHTEMAGNKKMYRANRRHPLFPDIHGLLMKHTGIDQILDRVVTKLGGLHRAYVIGSFARGKDNPVIDLLLVGNAIDREYLLRLIEKAEKEINRRIRFIIIHKDEVDEFLKLYPEALLLWEEVK